MKILPITKERYWAYLKWIITARGWFQQFTPFSEIREEIDTCVIGNGIPKSGTYFLNKVIEYLNKWEKLDVHINPTRWNKHQAPEDIITHPCLVNFSLKKLQNGQFVAAHLPWNQDLERMIDLAISRRRIKHILIYRDPRDTFISYLNYTINANESQYNPKKREEKKFLLENFSSDSERLTYVIKKRRVFHFLAYEPWRHSAYCHAVRFEELYQDLLKTKDGVWGVVLTNLFTYLEIDPHNIDPVDFYNNVYNKGHTASGEKNKIAQYKRDFNDQHYALLDTPEFKKVLETFGYEW